MDQFVEDPAEQAMLVGQKRSEASASITSRTDASLS